MNAYKKVGTPTQSSYLSHSKATVTAWRLNKSLIFLEKVWKTVSLLYPSILTEMAEALPPPSPVCATCERKKSLVSKKSLFWQVHFCSIPFYTKAYAVLDECEISYSHPVYSIYSWIKKWLQVTYCTGWKQTKFSSQISLHAVWRLLWTTWFWRCIRSVYSA